MYRINHYRTLALAGVISSALVLSACEPGDDRDSASEDVRLSMELPDSLTGGKIVAGAAGARTAAQGTGEPCTFAGPSDEDDPLRNGYEMSRFMISAIATWTCIADLLIDIAAVVPHDGGIVETDNDPASAGYDPDDPTHFSIVDDTSTQTTVRMFYGFDFAEPPTSHEQAGFFVSWHTEANGDLLGRMVIDTSTIGDSDPDDPGMMRMDFVYTANAKTADMFLRFDEANDWAEGFRIEVTQDLTASPLGQVYTARGLLAMNAQFLPVPGISELPDIRMYTVADRIGEGAAIAVAADVSLPLALNPVLDNHLGNYLFDKTDRYFFDDDQSWDWIDKQISRAVYRSGRMLPDEGLGTWIPFNPSADQIEAHLGLADDYLTAQCAVAEDDCAALLNAVFEDGFADQEPNQGMDPMDWRSDAIAAADYLESVYPNGLNWDGAFDMTFTP